MIATLVPLGVRPLVLLRLDDSWVVASETCAFYIIFAIFERDIDAGEMFIITADGLQSLFTFKNMPSSRFCVFEY